MTDTECDQAYEQLVLAINKVGFSWLTNQVAEEIRFGKIVTKRVASRPDAPEDLLFEDLTERQKRSKVKVSATRPFTAKEKLHTLLASMEQTILATEDMEAALTTAFGRYTARLGANWSSIQLVRTDEPDRVPIAVSSDIDKERAQRAANLRGLIRMLSEAI